MFSKLQLTLETCSWDPLRELVSQADGTATPLDVQAPGLIAGH